MKFTKLQRTLLKNMYTSNWNEPLPILVFQKEGASAQMH
jgi:hypothetical protein